MSPALNGSSALNCFKHGNGSQNTQWNYVQILPGSATYPFVVNGAVLLHVHVCVRIMLINNMHLLFLVASLDQQIPFLYRGCTSLVPLDT